MLIGKDNLEYILQWNTEFTIVKDTLAEDLWPSLLLNYYVASAKVLRDDQEICPDSQYVEEIETYRQKSADYIFGSVIWNDNLEYILKWKTEGSDENKIPSDVVALVPDRLAKVLWPYLIENYYDALVKVSRDMPIRLEDDADNLPETSELRKRKLNAKNNSGKKLKLDDTENNDVNSDDDDEISDTDVVNGSNNIDDEVELVLNKIIDEVASDSNTTDWTYEKIIRKNRVSMVLEKLKSPKIIGLDFFNKEIHLKSVWTEEKVFSYIPLKDVKIWPNLQWTIGNVNLMNLSYKIPEIMDLEFFNNDIHFKAVWRKEQVYSYIAYKDMTSMYPAIIKIFEEKLSAL